VADVRIGRVCWSPVLDAVVWHSTPRVHDIPSRLQLCGVPMSLQFNNSLAVSVAIILPVCTLVERIGH
jgi:hypothetical protein